MDGDRFISTSKNIHQYQNRIEDEDNFFMSDGINTQYLPQTEPRRHLNDYDNNILQDGAYKDINDDILKLEYKISKTEDELHTVNKQLKAAQEIYDYYLSDNLNSRRIILEQELKELNDIYTEASLSAKISSGLTSKIRNKFASAGKVISDLGATFVSKLPKKLTSAFEIKHSLEKLENINKSVDELMNAKYPYGEAEYRYEQLSRYIARANSIQSEISKFIK